MQYIEQSGIIYPTLCSLYRTYKVEVFSLIIIVLLLTILCKKNKSSLATYVSTKDLSNHNKIEKILKQMRVILDCDRVVIGIFHTENKEDTLLPFKSMSVIYETCKDNVNSKKDSLINLPILNIQSEIRNLNPYKFIKFSVSQSNVNPNCAAYLEKKGIYTKYCRLLSSKQGAYGILEIHYLTEPSFDFLNNPIKLSMVKECFAELKELLKEANITSTTL
jgi:hypothetical protein